MEERDLGQMVMPKFPSEVTGLNLDINSKSMEKSDLQSKIMQKFPSEITGLKFENDFKFNSETEEIEKESKDRTSRSQKVRLNNFES